MPPDDGLRALFRKHLPGPCHWQTVEHLLDRGVPDSNVCLLTPAGGVECWIEYKSVKRGWAIGLRPEQVAWALRRTRAGGRVVIAVRRRVLKDGCDDLYLIEGKWARELKDHGIGLKSPPHLYRCPGGPAKWQWDKIRAALLNTP